MEPSAGADVLRKAFLLLVLAAITAVFFAMIRSFLMALLLAAIFTGLCRPLHRKLVCWLRGREALASLATVLTVFLGIVVPAILFTGVVASQAVEVSENVRPWLADQVDQRGGSDLLERLPLPEFLQPYRSQVLAKIGELAGRLSGFLVQTLAAATRGTVQFFFLLFIMLYAMFFFLRDGRALLDRILYFVPLDPEQESRMVERFLSVTRATIKGTLVIGIVQGGLAGLALAVAGIPGAAFWGTVMAVLSIIPGLGTALVWVPAAIYLFAVGEVASAAGVALWCGLLVGTADNFLRPMLVGRDTRMPDLLILISTLGGLFLFGAVGIVVGPLVAALFVTIWDIYGVTFGPYLAGTTPQPESAG